MAAARGIPEEGDALQNLGESLIRELSFEGFCRAVIEESQWVSGESLVVDGIRHVNAYDAIKVIVAPVQARLFFVDVPREVRQVRAQNRGRSDRTDLTKADTHSTEKEVHGALKTLADHVLDGTVVLETLIARVEDALGANVESS